jgi:hypothetical protein
MYYKKSNKKNMDTILEYLKNITIDFNNLTDIFKEIDFRFEGSARGAATMGALYKLSTKYEDKQEMINDIIDLFSVNVDDLMSSIIKDLSSITCDSENILNTYSKISAINNLFVVLIYLDNEYSDIADAVNSMYNNE